MRAIQDGAAVRGVVAIALILIAGGCGGQRQGAAPDAPRNSAPASAPSESGGDLTVVSLTARVGRDLVRSTGTVLDANRGLVLTTAHAVWGATSLKVTTGLGVLHGRIVARNA